MQEEEANTRPKAHQVGNEESGFEWKRSLPFGTGGGGAVRRSQRGKKSSTSRWNKVSLDGRGLTLDGW